MNRKILLTTPTFPPINSGLGNAVQQLAKFISEQGWDVVVATGGGARNQYKDILSGALVEQFNISGADSMAQPLQGDIDSYVHYLKSSQFDVILMNAWQTWSTDIVLSHCEKINGKKLLYSHCISTNSIVGPPTLRSLIRYLAWRPYWWSLSKKIPMLDGIIFLAADGCDARFDDARLAKRLGVNQIVIPNTLSVDSFSRAFTGSSSFMKRGGILSVGAYDWQKGHDFVLRVYAKSKLKNKVRLDIYGQKFTSFSQDLRNLSTCLGLDPRWVQIHEGISQSDLLDEYSKARIFLYGSHTECQPLVLLDSMAAGTPFISRASGSVPFMKGGIAVRSEEQAAEVIDRLYKSESEWSRLSAAGQNEVIENHSPDKVMKLLSAALG
ncbi:glycosyltransferase family 4 protein [Polynucleobacter paneuropaeus]|nr:glycosyltransferase family 4 protein [Polynucleobacter paneuropaeus]